AVGDTHGGASNMQYGLDNWIWGMQGYNKSTLRIGDKETSFAQGFHRFRPDGSAIEFLRSTNNNTWGLGLSEEGVVFGSTANGNPSEYMPIPNRYYEQVRGWTPQLTLGGIADSNRIQPITDRVRQVDHHGGHTAAAGHALYTARAYPQEYWNRTALVCEPTGHLVGVFVLTPDGAGFRSTSPFNLLASDDEWTAPTMAEVGPDGAVWVIDWYNYIVQHNPTPQGFETGKGAAYETDLRDKTHARIYRVVSDKAPTSNRLDLSKATPEELVKTLTNDNLFWRRHAQRLLVERGKHDVVPHLLELINDESVDEIGLNVAAIHALWTLNGLGFPDGDAPFELQQDFAAALRHPSAGVRRNAVQALPAYHGSTSAILDADLLRDPDPQIRLQTLLALADQPASPKAGRAIAAFIAKPENAADRWLVDAAISAAAPRAADFLIASAARGLAPPPTAAECQVAKTIANHYARSTPGPAVNTLLAALADADPTLAGAMVEGLQDGWRPGIPLQLDEPARASITKLRDRLSLVNKIHLARLALHSGSKEMQPYIDELTDTLFERIEKADLPLADRAGAADLVIAAQADDAEIARRLLSLATPQAPPELSLALVRALRESRAPNLGAIVLEQSDALAPSTRDGVFELLLSRTALTMSLLDAMEAGDIQPSELSLIHRQRLHDYPDRPLKYRAREIFAKGSANISDDRKQVLADFADLAKSTGDAAAGKPVFTKNCAICHRLRGEGASVGPDLSGMAVHGKDELLIHLLDPNRDVEGNFVTYTALTADGLVISGMLAGESGTSIELIDAQGKRHAILREDIEELSRSGTSLMPEGFEKQLSRTELADLLAHLTENTGFIPLDLGRVATVTSARGMFHAPDATLERFIFSDWGPKTVEGIPFYPADPQDGRVRNVVMLYSPRGVTPPTMPRTVELPCHTAAKAIHFLSGVSGWGFPNTKPGTVSMIVRLRYADGATEDHELKNGVHFADYLGDTNVEGSKLAHSFGQQQIRYFKIEPKRQDAIEAVELVKGPDETAPLVMAVTAEQ
nr:c-type cytochrome [Pirellulales bacterium]